VILTQVRASIVVRTVMVVLGATLLVGLLTLWVTNKFVLVREVERQQEAMEALVDVVEPSASAACFVEDRALAEQVVQGIVSNRGIQSAVLRSGGVELAKAVRGPGKVIRQGAIPITRHLYSPFSKDQVIGELVLMPDPWEAGQRVARAVLPVRLVVFGLTLTLGLVLIFTIHQTVIRPITALSRRLHALEAVEGSRLIFPEGHERDEIGRLVQDVNALVERLVNALLKEQELSEQLSLDQRRVQSILENAGTGIFVVKGDGALEAWTPAFLRLLGLEGAPPLPGTPFQVLFGLEANQVEEWLNRCRTEGTRHLEILQAPDFVGESGRWLQLTLDPIGPDWIQGMLDDVTTHHEAMVAAETLALHDPLTGASNRLGAERALVQRLSKGVGRLGLMLLDLDLFKQINDTFGHDAGDVVLRQVPVRLGAVLRRSDIVARPGGDEFLVIIDTLESGEVAFNIAQKIIQAITAPIRLPGGASVQVGVSVGIKLCGSEENLSAEALLKHADIAMYQAKQAGGSCCRIYKEPASTP